MTLTIFGLPPATAATAATTAERRPLPYELGVRFVDLREQANPAQLELFEPH